MMHSSIDKVIPVLLFLTIFSNYRSGGISFVGALPVIQECADVRNLSSWCPNLIPSESMKNNNPPKCLSKSGQTCPDTTLLGGSSIKMGFGSDGSWGSCDNYFLVTDPNFNHTVSSLCLPNTNSITIQLFFRTQINESFCILSNQQYNISSTENEGCENGNKTMSHLPCSQTVYNCSKQFEKIFMDELMKQRQSTGFKFSKKLAQETKGANSTSTKNRNSWKEGPLPLVANSNLSNKHPDRDRRRVERADGIRRVKKPTQFNWRNHILEITIASILAIVLLYYCLKRCCEGKLINFHPNARVVRFEMEEITSADKRRFSSNVLSNNSPKYRNTPIDPNKNPSRPILKNSNNNNTTSNAKQKSKTKPPLNRILGQASAAIKSFDSNTSIYYDALEGLEGPAAPEEKSHFQPLIADS